VYFDDRALRVLAVEEEPAGLIHSRIVEQIGIHRLNPLDPPDAIDPTALIRRDAEIAQLRGIDSPIVTISGPRSVGKSVLARQAFSSGRGRLDSSPGMVQSGRASRN
jgi:hypothetical protein